MLTGEDALFQNSICKLSKSNISLMIILMFWTGELKRGTWILHASQASLKFIVVLGTRPFSPLPVVKGLIGILGILVGAGLYY